MITTIRTINKTGSSLCVLLPNMWLEHNKLKHRDELKLTLDNEKLVIEVSKNERRNEDIRPTLREGTTG